MADVFGVMPSYMTAGGPRTVEEELLATGGQEEATDNFVETLINEALPEYRDLIRFAGFAGSGVCQI